jgi:predicted DNA-binding antitoxin AbrB/MazE fold protein/predicted nucleotidyltransferase
MPKSLKVIYEDGVFKPLQKVDLKEHQKLELVIKKLIEDIPSSQQAFQQESPLHSVELLGDRLTQAERVALSNLITSLRADWPLAKFTLFGSKANGMADEESDLDLLVILPCPVNGEIRRRIVHKVFEINLTYGSNISVLIVSEEERERGTFSVLPIHIFIEEEGIPL